ncbi:hypothetical protein G6F22_016408 [Rhizopus arrhizus]|nr:hypothetical protein G6F22_016408 [Rhizopus arrhizus]
MDDQPRVLQQRIEVAAFQWHRIQAQERVGGEDQEGEEADADHTHHRQDARLQRCRQVPREQRYRAGPQRQYQCPHQQRAFVRAPHRRIAVDHRQQRIGVLGHVAHREILLHECGGEHGERAGDQQQLGKGGRSRHRHPGRVVAMRAHQRQASLQQRGQQRAQQQDLTQFGQHSAHLGCRHRHVVLAMGIAHLVGHFLRHVLLIVLGQHFIGDENPVLQPAAGDHGAVHRRRSLRSAPPASRPGD